jgi:carbon storage regulator
MLVLSRKAGERIVIDHSIVVTLVDIGCGRVRIGIDAPARVNIRRSEVQPRSPRRIIPAPAVETRN